MITRLRADVIASSWTTDTLDELLSDGALSALMRDSRYPHWSNSRASTPPQRP